MINYDIETILNDIFRTSFILLTIYVGITIYKNGHRIYNGTRKKMLSLFISLPKINSVVNKDLEKSILQIQTTLHQTYKGFKFYDKIPNGLDLDEILALSKLYQTLSKQNLYEGKISGCVYIEPLSELIQLQNEIFKQYSYTNPLHPDIYPGIMKMEAEVVHMCCNLFGGNEQSCGVMTSGGTESILLACLAYRNYASKNSGINDPEILIGKSAHVAFNKACHYFGIKCIIVPLDKNTLAIDLCKLKTLITWKTIAIVASAPNYPHGIIDPISEVAKIGLQNNVPVHVDCCLGGFLIPFAFDAGFDDIGITKFLMCPGVTSVSADTHKYGYTPKGSSVILYSDHKYLHAQYYIATEWMGGMYPSQTLMGSRSGLNIALTWATLMYFGRKRYVEATQKIITTCRLIVDTFREKEVEPRQIEFKIMGEPKLNVVAFGNAAKSIYDIYELGRKMTERGWNLNYLQNPHGIHICITLVHTKNEVCEGFVKDMLECDKELKLENEAKCAPKKDSNIGALYCFAQSISNQAPIEDVLKRGYLDGYYSKPT